jgi:hypothetical protein
MFTSRHTWRMRLLSWIFAASFIASVSPAAEQQASAAAAEALIAKLPGVSNESHGYSAMFSGQAFLPVLGSERVDTTVLGVKGPVPSEAMRQLVAMGAKAIPSLMKHLDDATPTKIPAMSGMTWMSFDDEYDFNKWTRRDVPAGVNRGFDLSGDRPRPKEHVLTVADLCFVAVGQIVNRNFSATRYQPSGGMIVSSPSYSTALREVIRKDYLNLTEADHKKQLMDDFKKPDHEFRRNGAAMRLAYYYPSEAESLIVGQLAAPTFDVLKVEELVRNVIYKTISPELRQQDFAAFLKKHGEVASDGILMQLFDDLDSQVADEEGRRNPPMEEKHDARNALIQLYKYPPTVKVADRPFVSGWAASEQTRFIESIAHWPNPSVDEAVWKVFQSILDDDALALACMARLEGGDHDTDLIAYCQRRIPKSKYFKEELKAALSSLQEN